MLQFDRFDASACGFPPPAVPLLPILRLGDLRLGSGTSETAAALKGSVSFSRGRYALHEAFTLAGLGADSTLMAPSYHCRTMIDPALVLGANVEFYPLDTQLAPSVGVIKAGIDSAAYPVKALILPHYFGFSQASDLLDDLTAMCAEREIVLVEDCSHSWQLAMRASSRIASPWHMAVASPYKSFAAPDGGTLWHRAGSSAATGFAPGVLTELKSLINVVRHRGRKLGEAGTARSSGPMGIEHLETTPVVSAHYAPSEETDCGLALSRWIVRHTDLKLAASRRSENYRMLLEASRNIPHARPLFDSVPAESAPYMFPLYIERGAADFHELKSRGMPIWRWDDMARSSCAVATDYRLRLLHLPCHQDLSRAQLQWMCVQLAETMALIAETK